MDGQLPGNWEQVHRSITVQVTSTAWSTHYLFHLVRHQQLFLDSDSLAAGAHILLTSQCNVLCMGYCLEAACSVKHSC